MVNVFLGTSNEGLSGGGYYYRFNEVHGFCHLNGWITVGLDIMPTTGDNYEFNKEGWKKLFSRDTEVVRTGYHEVTLDQSWLDVGAISNVRVDYHRYKYANAGRTDVIVSLGGKSGSTKMVNGYVTTVAISIWKTITTVLVANWAVHRRFEHSLFEPAIWEDSTSGWAR